MTEGQSTKLNILVALLIAQTLIMIGGFIYLYTAPENKLKKECNQYIQLIKGINGDSSDDEFYNKAYKGCVDFKGGPAWEASLDSGD